MCSQNIQQYDNILYAGKNWNLTKSCCTGYVMCALISSCHIMFSILYIASIFRSAFISCFLLTKSAIMYSTVNNIVCYCVAVVEPPVLISGPHNVNIQQTVQIKCIFTASQTPYLTICGWSNEDGRINPSHKYHFNQTSVPGRDNQVACTLTVSNVTNADEGKYYCYCYYNESFWLKYHFPQYSNISSRYGEISIQFADNSSKW